MSVTFIQVLTERRNIPTNSLFTVPVTEPPTAHPSR
jgi:hypothetical protein